jgi:hypothetical protein
MEALSFYLNKRADQNISTETLLKLFDLVLTTSDMQFNEEFFRQCKGIPMGSRIGSGVACLTMGYIERNMLSQYDGAIPILFKRYIDDILGIFVGSHQDLEAFIDYVCNFHENIKYTHEISNQNLAFLDLKLSIEDNGISTTINYKDTDSHNCLRYDSSHPPSCKKSIPYSQLLRAKRTCSKDNDFNNVAEEMVGFFNDRGYPSNITQSARNRVNRIQRTDALQPTSHAKSSRTPLVLTYHPHNVPIRNIIFKNFKTLQRDSSTQHVFTDPPVTAFRKDRNLSNHLVRASHPNPSNQNISQAGTYSCTRKRCNTCPYVTNANFLQIHGPSGNFNITDHFTCTSKNVVYIIICSRCNVLYVGETMRRLADRFTEHLRSIRCNFEGFPVARHFNPPNSCSISDIKVTGAIIARGNNKDRITAEHKLIFKLGTVNPNGLNNKFNNFCI